MFVLMGANGNITSKTAKSLIKDGKKVRVVGRDAARLAALKGAETAIGDAGDPRFLAGAFRGATAVYVMIPPDYSSKNPRAHQDRMGEAIAKAVVDSGVKRVVNLSSVGASLEKGTGPIAGLHAQEERLNAIKGLDLVHLRPAYFFENHFGALHPIKGMGVYPGMIKADVAMPMIATQDIAAAVAQHLAGKERGVKHLLGPRSLSMREAASILGKAIGKPGLAYVEAPPAQAKPAMVGAGFSPAMADLFEEMSGAFSDGRVQATCPTDGSGKTPTPLEEWAPAFAGAFAAMK